MRKKYSLVAVLALSCWIVSAQSKLGLKFSPSVSTTRVSLVDSMYDVAAERTAFKFSLGLIYDHEITETYFFSTGLIFVPKQVAFNVTKEPNQPTAKDPKNTVEQYRLNYLQIPLSLKLYTNEVQPDMQVFFQVGLAPEFKVFSEPVQEDFDLVEKFRGFDTSILFGGGVEYRAGINTSLFASLTYQRGLINTLKSETFGFQDVLYLRSTIVSLDLGIKF